MSEITLNVADADRSIHRHIHGGFADRIVAALAADPESIEELQVARGRFSRQDPRWDCFACWPAGLDHQPWDAGILYIDLAARLIAYRSTYSSPTRSGQVDYHDGTGANRIQLFYHLSDDWMLTRDIDAYRHLSPKRRQQRLALKPLDVRAVLYGKLPEYLVRELHARQSELGGLNQNARSEFVKQVHSQWLLTPRPDLRERCPRQWIIDDRHEHIERDLRNQEQHLLLIGQPPPGLSRESHAYRFGGFGTREIVLYYNLVRKLLNRCVDRLSREPVSAEGLPGEAEHLQMLCQEWMHTPQEERLHGRTPMAVIDNERRRRPEFISAKETIIDHDCPICQMMAEISGPFLWDVNSSHMDEDYVFSFERTRQEWQKRQRKRRKRRRKLRQRQARQRKSVVPNREDPFDDIPF